MDTTKPEIEESVSSEVSDDNIKRVVVSDVFKNPIATGNRVYDKIFTGNGIRRTTVTLVTGRAGSGKTSLLQQLFDLLSLNDEECLPVYNGLEQSGEQMKLVFDRLNLKNGFDLKSIADFHDLMKYCKEKQAANPTKTLILAIDSLQYLKYKGAANKLQKQINVLHELRAWANETHAIVFVVGMVGKDGNYLGSGELEHVIDVWLELYMVIKRNAKNYGKRCAVARKNRHGDAMIDFPYTVGDRGVRFLEEEQEETSSGSALDKIKEMVKNTNPMELLNSTAQAANKINNIFNAVNKVSRLFGGGKKKK